MHMQNLTREFQPSRLLPNVTAGLIAGIIEVMIELSFAVLIFAGPLANHVAEGIGLLLFGAAVMSLVVALTSSFAGTQAGPQDSPAAILALVASVIVTTMSPAASSDTIFSTVVAAIALTSILTGVFFLILGRFRLGNLVRFIPYPVVGGFLAGTGWLIVLGALGAMVGAPISFSTSSVLFQPDVIVKWLPGVLLGILLLVVLRRYDHFLIMPALLLGAVGLFYAVLALTHISIADASAQGWLLGPFPSGSLWRPLTLDALAQVNWSVILGQADKIGTILIVAVISLLLNANGLELAVRQEVNLNRELESAGVANVLAGIGGAPTGYLLLSTTVLVYKINARGRVTAFIIAALYVMVLLFGTALVSLFPKPVLGGLLFFLGLVFLSEWVYDARLKLPRTDYALVLVVLSIIAAIGLLEGVIAGLAIAIALFVLNYSRVNVIRHALSGANFHSTVDRPPSQRQFLRQRGEQLWILQLQGFVFFGTAQKLFDLIRERVVDSKLSRLRFLVLDFGRVNGLDSSAVSSFVKIQQFAETKDIRLALAHLSSEMQCQLERGGFADGRTEGGHLFSTLDHAVEWCENEILVAERSSIRESADSLSAQLRHIFPQTTEADRFMSYLEKEQVGANQLLVHQGDPADALYFIEDGVATAQFELPDGRTVRLRTMQCGTIIGEVGLYLGDIRTASVMATEPSTLYRLSAGAIQRMEEQDPEIAAALHRWIARLMAERLAENNNTLAAMMD